MADWMLPIVHWEVMAKVIEQIFCCDLFARFDSSLAKGQVAPVFGLTFNSKKDLIPC